MGTEIERKFTVHGQPWLSLTGQQLVQGYLAREMGVVVRIRTVGDAAATLTIKGPAKGLVRPEFEYPVPLADAQALLVLCGPRTLRKVRYAIPVGAHLWEVDVFEGRHQGLVLAEVELTAEDEPFERPAWVDLEVTSDVRYLNSSLVDEGMPCQSMNWWGPS